MIPLLLLTSELVWAACVVVALTATPARSQTITVAPTVAATQSAAHRRPTWEERFSRANTTGDGRLTLGQAQAGYPSIARRFDEIDRGHKGYVTEDDVRAWREAMREKRRARKEAAPDPLRPRKAYQRADADMAGAPTTQVIGPQAGSATGVRE